MADEIKEESNEPQKQEEIKLSPVEEKAASQGWVPKDQWDGDPEEWRPAKEFLDRGELFKKIEEVGRDNKQLRRALNDLAQHHAKVREVEYKRALDELKAQKKTALAEGDADAVVDIDEKIDIVRDAQRQSAQQPVIAEPQAPTENPIFVAWKNRNTWYERDRAMKAFADQLGREYASSGMSPTDVLSRVEQEVKKEFSAKFQNPNRDKPGAVEGSSTKGRKSGEDFSLSEDERRVMQRFVNTIPGFKKEDYIAELKRVKGVS